MAKRKYRKVNTGIWNDKKFRAMSDNGKLVFLFLLTHPHMTPLGAMRAYLPGLACELEWTLEGFAEAFKEASGEAWEEASGKRIIEYDERVGIVWFPNFIKHNPPESPNVIKSWSGGYHDLPECDMKDRIIQKVFQDVTGMSPAFKKAFAQAFGEVCPQALLNQEQEQEQEQDKEAPSGACVPPDGGDAPGEGAGVEVGPQEEGGEASPEDGPPEEPTEGPDEKPEAGKTPPCPYTRIVEAYNVAVKDTACPQVREITEARKRVLRARWVKHPDRQNLDWWRDYFQRVARSAFLTGQKNKFKAGFDWLINPGNMVKVLEGNYDEAPQQADSTHGGITDENYDAELEQWANETGNGWLVGGNANGSGDVPETRPV